MNILQLLFLLNTYNRFIILIIELRSKLIEFMKLLYLFFIYISWQTNNKYTMKQWRI